MKTIQSFFYVTEDAITTNIVFSDHIFQNIKSRLSPEDLYDLSHTCRHISKQITKKETKIRYVVRPQPFLVALEHTLEEITILLLVMMTLGFGVLFITLKKKKRHSYIHGFFESIMGNYYQKK